MNTCRYRPTETHNQRHTREPADPLSATPYSFGTRAGLLSPPVRVESALDKAHLQCRDLAPDCLGVSHLCRSGELLRVVHEERGTRGHCSHLINTVGCEKSAAGAARQNAQSERNGPPGGPPRTTHTRTASQWQIPHLAKTYTLIEMKRSSRGTS